MKNIYDLTKKQLADYFVENDYKKFRATQVFEALYRKNINEFNEISNIKKEVIIHLNENFEIPKLEIVKVQKDQLVRKYLFKLEDGLLIEAVLMKHEYGNSLCISTQVGCNMGCSFCESGKMKKSRDLTAGEMVMQVIQAEEEFEERISHIVIMGMGEPFDNYQRTLDFIKIINDAHGLAIGARHITVSTSGIVPSIKLFMEEDFQVNLAISLHAPNNEVRDKIMPINKVYNINVLMASVRDYINKTNRRVTFEYILLHGVNDKVEHAKELCRLIKGINCYVNLIPYNETSTIAYKKSSKEKIDRFYKILKDNKINVTVRREFGSNIDAACGQLSGKEKKE